MHDHLCTAGVADASRIYSFMSSLSPSFVCSEFYASQLFDDMSMWPIIVYLGDILQVIHCELVRGARSPKSSNTRAQRCGFILCIGFAYQSRKHCYLYFKYSAVLPFFHLFTISFRIVICLPGFTHNKKTKEYGQMLNPELQDGVSISFFISQSIKKLYLCYHLV
jgi:hypothetical protein